MTLDELEAARVELAGSAFGSKSEFAKMLGLKGHHSLRGYHRRNSVPQWIEDRIRMLREIRDLRKKQQDQAAAKSAKRSEVQRA